LSSVRIDNSLSSIIQAEVGLTSPLFTTTVATMPSEAIEIIDKYGEVVRPRDRGKSYNSH